MKYTKLYEEFLNEGASLEAQKIVDIMNDWNDQGKWGEKRTDIPTAEEMDDFINKFKLNAFTILDYVRGDVKHGGGPKASSNVIGLVNGTLGPNSKSSWMKEFKKRYAMSKYR